MYDKRISNNSDNLYIARQTTYFLLVPSHFLLLPSYFPSTKK
jgi:hypothetical protein